MNLTGYRTYAVMFVSMFLVPWAAKHGLPLSEENQVWAVGAIMALIAFAMRTITKSAPGQSVTTVLPPPQQVKP